MINPAMFIESPDWYRIFPETRTPEKTRHLPTHADCSEVDREKAAGHLRRGGTLGAMPGYEERPGQIDMLCAVVQAFNRGEHLMIEAGTGVGKSLAYLIPSVLWSWLNDTPTVISTATRNLQSQLIGKDIPRALETLGEHAKDCRVALLKGRGNYLCLRAVAEFFAPGYWTMSAEEQAEMPHFIDWMRTTPDGDLDRYEGLPRAVLTCPGEECGGRRCPYYSRCLVYRARREAASAHLVVVNHALVMADAANPGGGILPAYGRLVLDEAHNLEEIATEYLENEFSIPALTRLLGRLRRHSRRGRGGRAAGVLASVERQLRNGVLAGRAEAGAIDRALTATQRAIGRVERAAESLAETAARLLRPVGDLGVCRYRTQPDADGAPIRQHSLHGLFKPYGRDEWDEEALGAAEGAFEAAMAALVNLLHDLRDAIDGSVPEGEFNYLGDLSTQVNGIAGSLVDFSNSVHFVLKGERDTHAYWIERVARERHAPYVRLVAAPLTVADDLKRMLYDVKDSVVLCSATLRVGNDFRYMARRLGCGIMDVRGVEESPGRFRALTAASPFDYLRQALVLAPDCLPDPATDATKYAVALAALLRDLFKVTQGRALVLFTSYEMMNAVAVRARGDLDEAGLKLLVQGEGMSREAMTAALRAEGSTVVFGAQSFWEGVDVSGEALSCVVLARLPFAQMGDPVIEARGEKIDREGGSSFRDYSLPEAVIRFRQGFGRLIRSKGDRGVVIVTDPRLVTKNYGATFRRSIPGTVHTVTSPDDLLGRVRDFFGVG